jgi:hypothetical protein
MTQSKGDTSRAGHPWCPQEDALLEEYFDRGLTIEDLAWVHQRSFGAIQSRLYKLGRIEVCSAERACYKITREYLFSF